MKSYFRASFVLRNVTITPRIDKIQSFAPDQHVHYVRLANPEEVDEDIRALLLASTEYGEQQGRHG
ncbi:hypothetical protein OP10G_4399 [Fimbriimonas ginsengisoli Gsoil 348]|uniref:DUF5655 domain-containing protein n=2 Tax=Fimbriimonas ginsengisoli TaxID=1005039 RepID=A0A068NWM3_FIMGI|nr:hypothetical protein OP10G_4399 [Fimbriimonas ginsengisoli Gsoil 348]